MITALTLNTGQNSESLEKFKMHLRDLDKFGIQLKCLIFSQIANIQPVTLLFS